MTRGAIDVFKASSKWIANYECSISSLPAKRMPVLFGDEAKFGVSNRQGLLRLLGVTEKMLQRRDGIQKTRKLMRLQ